MDPPTATLMNETTSYNLSEIWPVPMNGGGPFAPNSTRFTESALIREGSGNDAVYTGSARKRREKIVEDAAMGSGNDAIYTGSARKRREKIVEDAAMSDSDGKRIKSSGSGDENQTQKGDGEVNSGKGMEKTSKAPLDAQKDYIHVRARRGQATDSHSLAERARREKISERMRILQDLVPGCNKVIGKALVLDEIINYIQSLQRQVEFLSMKLEAVNTRVSPGIEGFPSKDFGQQPFDTSGVGYCSQPAREYGHDPSPDWLHMHIGGGGFERQT